MKVQEIAITKIKPYEKNPRRNDAAVDAVAASIREFGWKQPIVVDPSTMEIIAGHTRYKAAKKLGLSVVPCVMADDLTAAQIKAYRLADNKTAELADWDFDLLGKELATIDDFDMTDFGFEFDSELNEGEVIEDEVPEADEENEPITKLGDIWQLGRHRLICGDSTDKATVERLMDGKQADMVLTDPPYNVAYEGKTEEALTIKNDSMESEEFNKFLTSAFERMCENLKDGGAFYVWFASREHINFETALNKAGFTVRQELIWVKNAMVLGRQDYQWKHEPCLYGWKQGAPHNWYSDRKQTTVLEFARPNANLEHPTMKPIALIAYQIGNSSKESQLVLDMFGGSGSTLIACEQLNRVCYMAELDPKYCDVIIKRWEAIAGKKAVRLEE